MSKSILCGVYKIYSPVGDDCYIGSSINIVCRWGEHKRSMRAGTHRNHNLQSAYLQSGDRLGFRVLETCHPKDLLSIEQQYIDRIMPSWNLSIVARAPAQDIRVRKKISMAKAGRQSVRTHSIETRNKISASMMGKRNNLGHVPSGKTRELLSKAAFGRKLTKEAIIKLSAAMHGNKNGLGHKKSDQCRDKISKAKIGNKCGLGYKHTEEARKKNIRSAHSILASA
jgi:group I intron endonuclease